MNHTIQLLLHFFPLINHFQISQYSLSNSSKSPISTHIFTPSIHWFFSQKSRSEALFFHTFNTIQVPQILSQVSIANYSTRFLPLAVASFGCPWLKSILAQNTSTVLQTLPSVSLYSPRRRWDDMNTIVVNSFVAEMDP